MALKEWAPNTAYRQGDCVVIPNGSGGYFGDLNGSKTWLLCCVGTGSAVDNAPFGVSGAVKTQLEWATLFEGTGSDGNVAEATVMPATLSAGAGPDGSVRWALGIAYFLDTSQSVNGTGTFSSPFNAASSISTGQITSSDGTNSVRHLYIKRGTTVNLTSLGAQWLGRGSSRRHYATLSDYGVGAIPRLDASATSGGIHGILISKAGVNAARFVLVENVEVYNASGDGVSAFIGTADPTLVQNDIIIRGVVSHDNGASGIQALTGGAVDRSASSTNILIENCNAYNNAIYGIAVREWWDGITFRGNKVSNNGLNAPNGAYGISTIGNFLAFTGTGWSQLSATPNVWQRSFSRTNNIIVGRYRKLDESEVILTAGVFGSLSTAYTIANSGSTVQVCLGAGETPVNQAIWLCYNRVKNITVVDNEVTTTNDFRAPEGRFDGDGLGIDQFSQSIVVSRNVVYNNGGCGIITNQPFGIWIYGNNFYNNGEQKGQASQTNAGILVNHPEVTAQVINNTVTNQTNDGIRIYSPNGVSAVVKNNLVRNCRGVALYGTLTVGGMTESYNWLSQNTFNFANITLSGTDTTASAASFVTGDGRLVSTGYTVSSPNPVAVFGEYSQGVTALNGRVRPGWTPAGCYVGVVPRALRS